MGLNAKRNGESVCEARLRAEIVEMTQTLHEIGVVSDVELVRTTNVMLRPHAQSRVLAKSPKKFRKT